MEKQTFDRLVQATLTSGLMIALIMVAFILRIYRLDYQSLWRDEIDILRFSGDSLLDPLRQLTLRGHNGPLYFVIIRGWRNLMGDSEFALRYFSLLAGVLMVALTYRVGRVLKLGRTVAGIAALLITTSPYLVWYSQEAKMYTWLVCLILISIYSYQSALHQTSTRRWWAVFVVSTSLAFYMHILSPLTIAIYLAWGFIQWPQVRAKWRGWLISIALLTLPYLPLLIWQFSFFVEGYQTGHPFYPFTQQLSLLAQLYSSGILRSSFGFYGLVIALFLGLVGLVSANEASSNPIAYRSIWLVGLWLGLPLVLIYLISLRVTVFEDRYLIYITPAFYLLMASGVAGVRRYSRPLAATCLGGFLTLNLAGGMLQVTQPVKADFRAAAAYIAAASSEPQTIMFQMPYIRYTFDYYFPTLYNPLEGPWTNDEREPAVVAQEMAEKTAGLNHLWLVASEEAQWDERGLTRQWLDREGRLIDEAHFTRVDLYYYDLSGRDQAGTCPLSHKLPNP